MRRPLVALAALLAIAAPALAPSAKADEASAIRAARSQPGVLDAMMDTGGNLFVVVKPQKAAWDAYARHLCEVVTGHQARIFKVRVLDMTSVGGGKPQAAWVTLGEARCLR